MLNTLAALGSAIQTLLGDGLLVYLVLGCTLGIVFGVIPGLNAPILLSLMIPITIGMDANPSFVLMGSALGGTTFAGSITAILFGVPGTANNVGTLMDGYPMGKQGRAVEGISAAAASSFFGALIGFVVLIVFIPIMRKIVATFGPPEIFWVTMLGIFLLSTAAKESTFKGLMGGGIGMLLACVGYSSGTGELRFTYGIRYLWSGFDSTIVVLGFFGIAEVIHMLLTRVKKSDEEQTSNAISGSFKIGFVQTIKNFATVIRGAIIGIFVGIIPGAGAGIADTAAYASAKKASKNPETFGTGNIVGVIAPESANNAKDAGALIPLLAFGIPGSLAVSILLGSFELHGIVPGPSMLTLHLDLSLVLILAVLIGGILSCVLGCIGLPVWKAVTKIPVSYLFPFVVGVSILGIYGANSNIKDIIVVVIFAILGYMMIRYRLSRVSVMLGFVLGSVGEKYFLQAVQISNGSPEIFFRNIVCWALIIFMLCWGFGPGIIEKIKARKKNKV